MRNPITAKDAGSNGSDFRSGDIRQREGLLALAALIIYLFVRNR